jgi:hypothetical protein
MAKKKIEKYVYFAMIDGCIEIECDTLEEILDQADEEMKIYKAELLGITEKKCTLALKKK